MRLLLLNLPQIHADLTISMISVSEIPPFWDIPDVTEVQCLEVFGVFFGDLPGASIWQKLPRHFGTGGGKQEKMGGFRCVLGGRSDDSNFPELNWWESGFQLYVYYICMYIYIYKKYLGGLWGKSQGTLWLYVWISRGFCFGSGEEVPLRTFAVGSLALSFPATWFTDSSLTLRQTWIMSQNPGRPFFVEWSTTWWCRDYCNRPLLFSFFETKGIAYIDEPRLFTTHQLWSEDVCVRESWTWPWYQFKM